LVTNKQTDKCWVLHYLLVEVTKAHTVTHSRTVTEIRGSISGRPHSKWWWCHDIGYPLLAAEH